MRKYLSLKWRKINPKRLIMFNRISITISGILIFLVWMMFLTKNFYPKSDDNLAAIIMNWPLQLSVWPVTLIILFVFIMPIWVTHSFELLVVFLLLSLLFLLGSLFFLIFLNVSRYWVVWLIANLLALANLIFAIFSIGWLNKKNVKQN